MNPANLCHHIRGIWFGLFVVSFASLFTSSPLFSQTDAFVQTNDQRTGHKGRVTRNFTEPIEMSVVAGTESGVVLSSHVKEGDRVKAGEILAVLNHDVLLEAKRLAVAKVSSTAERDAALSRAHMLKAQLEKVESLAAKGHANQYEVEQKVTEFENAMALYQSAEDKLSMSQIEVDRINAQIRQRKITSPISGFVTEVHKQPGEHISASDPKFATVVRVDQLKVSFYLKERSLNAVAKGATVNVYVGEGHLRRTGEVSFISPVIDPSSGTGRIDVVIDNHDFSIRSGTICQWGKPGVSQTASNKGLLDRLSENETHERR